MEPPGGGIISCERTVSARQAISALSQNPLDELILCWIAST